MADTTTKRVRLLDVAHRAGVSRIVAGHVLLGSGGKTTRVSAATAERVRQAARELDYRPNLIARQLSGVRTKTIAAFIGAERFTIHYDRLRAIDHEADKRGYRLMVGYLHGNDEEDITNDLQHRLDEMLGRGVEGVIFMHRFLALPDAIRARLSETHVVGCQTQPALPAVPYVDVDLANGMEQLVDHLVQRGRSRLTFVIDHLAFHTNEVRCTGLTRACKRHGLRPPAAWSADVTGDVFNPVQVRKHVDRLLDERLADSDTDAILASNDLWAVQVIKALLDRGVRVPQDIAVTGIDNVDIAAACIPELTTIDQCNDLIAQRVMDVIIKQIEGKRIPRKDRTINIQPKLIVRQST